MKRFFSAVLTLFVLPVILGGCAWRGPLAVNCPGFDSYLNPLAATPIEQQVRNAGLPKTGPLGVDDSDPMALAMIDAYRRLDRVQSVEPPGPDARPVMLLSGGGQWGAFGVGYMEALIRDNRFPDVGVVTGVSTGGLQALFVGMGIEKRAADGSYPVLQQVITSYSPAREGDVVKREAAKPVAVLTGAMANLKPLKRRIEGALCPALYDKASPRGRAGICMMDELRKSQRAVLIGFIEANSGEFKWVDVQAMLGKIAAQTPAGAARNERSVQCVTGAALSSAAMPVFFQQVRVDGRTYYDGGVRESVFLVAVEQAKEKADRALLARRAEWLKATDSAALTVSAAPEPPTLYVIRNGPTTLAPDAPPGEPAEVNRKADALTAALRAEAIVVNQLEVGSLAALRLFDPGGTINLVSAEGWSDYLPDGGTRTCGMIKQKPKGAMFNPDFMACLRKLGAERAKRPWVELCKYDGTERRPECRSQMLTAVRRTDP